MTITLRSAWIVIIAISILAISTAAFGAPPYFTDDPVPCEYHHFEVYLAGTFIGYQPGYYSTLPEYEVNYGAAPNLQLSITTQMALVRFTGAPVQYGIGDIQPGAKYRLIKETKSCPQIAIFPQVLLPTGDASRGLGNGQTAVFLPLWLQKGFGQWTVTGGGGYWVNPGPFNRNYWYTGVLLQKPVAKRITLGGEVFFQSTPIVGGPAQVGVNFGGTYDFDEGHHFLFSLGDDIRGSGKGLAYVGYGWTWGPNGAQRRGRN